MKECSLEIYCASEVAFKCILSSGTVIKYIDMWVLESASVVILTFKCARRYSLFSTPTASLKRWFQWSNLWTIAVFPKAGWL